MLKYMLLGFLNYRPMSGYDLEGWIEVSTGHFWHAKLSQIYVTLKKMEDEGLVHSEIEPQAGRPDRRVYSVTEAGRAELRHWLITPLVEPEMKKDSLLLKLFFGLPAGKTALLTQLRLQLELHNQQKIIYQQQTPQEMLKFLADQPELTEHALLWEMTRRYGEMYEDTYMEWLEETIRRVENLPD
ncbi:MAG: PadR family transcriptional regulator [Chloroflexota bacterium]